MMKPNETKTFKKNEYIEGLGTGTMFMEIRCDKYGDCEEGAVFVPSMGLMNKNFPWTSVPEDEDDYLRKEGFEEI